MAKHAVTCLDTIHQQATAQRLSRTRSLCNYADLGICLAVHCMQGRQPSCPHRQYTSSNRSWLCMFLPAYHYHPRTLQQAACANPLSRRWGKSRPKYHKRLLCKSLRQCLFSLNRYTLLHCDVMPWILMQEPPFRTHKLLPLSPPRSRQPLSPTLGSSLMTRLSRDLGPSSSNRWAFTG